MENIEAKANYTYLYARNYDCINVRCTDTLAQIAYAHSERDTNFNMPKLTLIMCDSYSQCHSLVNRCSSLYFIFSGELPNLCIRKKSSAIL